MLLVVDVTKEEKISLTKTLNTAQEFQRMLNHLNLIQLLTHRYVKLSDHITSAFHFKGLVFFTDNLAALTESSMRLS